MGGGGEGVERGKEGRGRKGEGGEEEEEEGRVSCHARVSKIFYKAHNSKAVSDRLYDKASVY